MFKFLRLLLLVLVCSPALIGQTVQMYQTTSDFSQTLKQQAPLTFTSSGTASQTITVNDAKTYQQIDGFGASMTDASAWVLYKKLGTTLRNEAMTKMFDRSNGIALRFIRIPMGSSDESVTVYSYDDLCTPARPTDYCTTPNGSDGKMLSDPTLANFSIAHDEDYIIPALQQARDLAAGNNEKIKFMANPWSPPGWMKTNGSMLGVANGVTGSLKPEAFDPLAQYFVKFIQGYAGHGLHMDYISMQNEPLYAPGDYSGLNMPSSDQIKFLVNNLAPAFKNAGIDSKIMVWDHNWDNTTYPQDLLKDAVANKLTAGVAWHHYAGNPGSMSVVHDLYPDKDVWETEASMIDSDSLTHVGIELINNMRNWAKSYVLWDLANDQNHGPHVGGCGICRPVVTVDYTDPNNVKYVLTTDYYALGQASKFIVPGAFHIDSDQQVGNNLFDVAFRNPDGSIVVYVTNSSVSDQSFNIKYGNQYVTANIKGNSIATFVWTPSTAPVVSLSQQPNGLTIPSGQSGSVNVTLTPLTGTPKVTLTCSVLDITGNVTTNFWCSAAQSSFTFNDSTPQTTSVTFSSTRTSGAVLRKPVKAPPFLAWISLGGLPLAGIVFVGRKGRRKRTALAFIALVAIAGVPTSCGGGGSTGGGNNPPPVQQQAAIPVFSPVPGTFNAAQLVTISDATPGATIYYTTDGSNPTASSAKYTQAIPVVSTQTLKAFATASGYTNSQIATGAYTINGTAGTFSMVITATPDAGAPVSITVPVLVQ